MTFAGIRIRSVVAALSLRLPLIVLPGEAIAGQLTLTWTDVSTNELGFVIERSIGSSGSFAQIGTTGAGATTYTDSTVPDEATYCYRVLAFNAYGNSDYTNTACGSVPPGAVVTVMPNGSGTGTINSSPAGISCGVNCSASFASGTVVTLSYTPTSGSVFSGWSGGGCSGTGTCTVTVTAATTVIATFTAQSPSSPSAPGLVAAYSFSQGTGNTVMDLSGNNNTGTIAGATWSAGGRYGSALFFNGSSYVTVPDTSSLDFAAGMTLEAWVYPTAPQFYWSTVIMKEQPGQFTYVLYAGSPDNRPHVFFNVGDVSSGQRGVAGSSGLPINTWTHLAGTYDGSTERLYVNGGLVASQDIAGLITTSNGVLRIGGNAVWGEYFQGFIDEVRIYNRALSASEIQSDMDSPVGTAPSSTPSLGEGLVAAYNFNENGGNSVTDLTGRGYTISLAGGTSWEAGHSDTALGFNGTTAYGSVASFPSLSTWTVSAWTRSPAVPSESPASGPVHRETNFQIAWDHPSPAFRGAAAVNVGGTWYAASFGALAADTWHYLTATYDGETLNAYSNGVLITSNTVPSGPASSDPNPLTFGKHAAAPQFFEGTVDDVRIYDRALSIPEIQSDMNTPL